MGTPSSTLLATAEPPTIPCFAPAAVADQLARPRRGKRSGPGVWEAAQLINAGTYSGRAVHAKGDGDKAR